MKQNDASAPGFHSSSPSQVSFFLIIDQETDRARLSARGTECWVYPMMDRSASGPRRSTLACAHWQQASPSSAARPIHHRQEESTGALIPLAPRMPAKPSGFQAKVDLHLLHAVVENAHASDYPHRTHTCRPIYSGGAS